jgi:hypothetical protein
MLYKYPHWDTTESKGNNLFTMSEILLSAGYEAFPGFSSFFLSSDVMIERGAEE